MCYDHPEWGGMDMVKKVERYFYPAVFTYEEGQEIAVVFPDLDVATPLSAVALEPNERVVLVDVYMPAVRMAQNNKSVNRTVTLPAWLNAAALERNINFSQVLQDALKTQMGI